ncbi:MAG TPA: DUF1761 domain-containing protein, partial [Cyclobacteriaceae bacterium]|nr:DUF1761 domain-containing protein [Cyclobacteriaceae bacterium]
MEELPINYLAILVAVVANFILGFLWYTPLFGKAWAKEMGFDTTVKPSGGEMAKGMVFMVVGNFLMAYVFAHNMVAWSFVPGMDQMPKVGSVMNSAIFTWLGFYLPMLVQFSNAMASVDVNNKSETLAGVGNRAPWGGQHADI